MKVIKIGKLRFSFAPALWIFAGLYLFFVLADLSASKQTGNRMADRSSAHYALIALVSYLLTYITIMYGLFKKRAKKSGILIALILMAGWIFLQNAFYLNFDYYMMIGLNMACLWILSYLFFYIEARQNAKLVNLWAWFFFIVYIVATIYYFFYASNILNRTPVLNVAYCVIALLPWIYVQASSKIRTLALFMALVPVLFSMKRGAYIALPCMLLADIFIRSVTGKNLFKRLFAFIAIALILFVSVSIADKYSDGFVSNRFAYEQLADGSGRHGMYALAWKDISNRNISQLFIGTGAGSSIDLVGTGIHNEWLEFLFTYGIIGLILYAFLIWSMLRKAYLLFKHKSPLAPAAWMMCVLYLILSLVSTGYGGYIGLLLFGFWGYIEGYSSNKEHI